MVLETNSMVMGLEYRGVIPVERALWVRIQCISGRIWLTEQESMKDVVLEAGDSYEITRDGVVVVQALRAAIVGLRARARPSAEPLATRVWRWCVPYCDAAGISTPQVRRSARPPAAMP